MKIKLIIWDLDDTLWRGTLADGETVCLHEARAELVRAFNERGVISSICSKNDFGQARSTLERMGLWDEFVFPRIAFEPKPQAIAEIIEDAQLRAENVLFVDDNPVNLNEVRFCLPEINVLDISADGSDRFLAELLQAQTGPARRRVEEYRILEQKKRDRVATPLSNEDFLRTCEIQACAPYLMDNLDFAERIEELVNRSNQLNYTASRITRAELEAMLIDVVKFDCWSIFAWDRYGDYGLVGFVAVDRAEVRLVHFTFSCRVMHMGLEEYALGKVCEKFPGIDSSAFDGRFSRVAPDWITDRPFHEPEVRSTLLARFVPNAAADAELRIAFDCQSGGIAHFSRQRGTIDFDNAPRVFALRMLIDGSYLDQPWPPFLVYGAGIDYSDPRWPELADLIDGGLYEACVGLMCNFLVEQAIKALVVLPPETAPDEKYRPHLGHTRERTKAFNALWRAAAESCDALCVLQLDDIAAPSDMSDVSHYHPGLLKAIAGRVDGWFDAASQPLGRGFVPWSAIEPRRAA